ncbi:carbon monoxide dehydrogenase [Palleronia sediminis]|uniref:Carbon monoxide dehydrogenase n=1 Tax=Palleronia sediminis TaxID=2547833 RepID=A0A4R6AE63_9RHOB|nr:carbon monoxide dehydrogenase subunit G [Palleronia sediminis]TDL79503.1 carbon monoxide dehydrogenase [Palleronia sediminis]
MEMTGSNQIDADPDRVWAGLLDPEVLKSCIPGCTEMTGTVEDGYDAVVVQKVGPVKATFRGQIRIEDIDPPQSCTISGEGKGGAAGFAKGGAHIVLSAAEGGTRLDYTVDAKVGGKLAQLGGRIIDGFSKKMADQFFECFKDRLDAAAAGEAAGGDASNATQNTGDTGGDSGKDQEAGDGKRRWFGTRPAG